MTKRTTITIDGLVPDAGALEQIRSTLNTESESPRYPRALDAILSQRWLIMPEALQTIIAVAIHGEGPNYRPGAAKGDMEALIDAFTVEGRPGLEIRNGTAVVHVTGPIFPMGNILTNNSGASSLRAVQADFAQAVDDPEVERIVLAIDSPGGVADGIHSFAEQVYAARARKPVIAVAQDLAASAALWIASAASEVVASPASMMGSLGVVLTARRERLGEGTVQIVSTQSPRKRQDPTSEDGRRSLQQLVDALAQVFVETVARNRGLDVEHVLANFGQGGVMEGAEAVRVGMADRLGTLPEVIAGSSGDQGSQSVGVSSMNGSQTNDTPAITRELIADKHPEIASAFRQEGREAAAAELRAEGATAERERIQAVQAQSLPGHEKLVQTLMFDGKTTGPEAAVQILNAERQAGSVALSVMRVDSIAPVPPSADAPPRSKADDDARPLEERAREAWERDEKLRAEFGGDFDAYHAFRKAEENGQVRRFSGMSA